MTNNSSSNKLQSTKKKGSQDGVKVAKKKRPAESQLYTRAKPKTVAEAVAEQTKGIRRKSKTARITPEHKELILAVYCSLDNISETARVTGVNRETVAKIRDESFNTGELHRLRAKNREKFVEEAWGCIEMAVQTIKDGLIKGYVKEGRNELGDQVGLVSSISPMDAARVIRDLFHVTQLEEGRPTSIVENLANTYSESELEEEIERVTAQIKKQAGSLH